MNHRRVKVNVHPGPTSVEFSVPVIWPKDDEAVQKAFEDHMTGRVVKDRTKIVWFKDWPCLVAVSEDPVSELPIVGDFTSLATQWNAFLDGLAYGLSLQIEGNQS